MQWSNYLYANGGQYHDANWKATFDGEAGVKAVEDFKNDIAKHGPTGAESFCFDEADSVFGQGKAYSFVTFNILLCGLRRSELLAGRRQGRNRRQSRRRPEWRLGLGHSELEPEQGRGLDLHQVGRIEGDRQEAHAGRRRADARPGCSTIPRSWPSARTWTSCKILVATAQEFPTFTYTVDFVESLGRELNLAVTGQKDAKEALDLAAEDFNKLARESRLAESSP